jgi:hypothetical protein
LPSLDDMKEAAAPAGGHVEVEPRAGGGTLVRFEVPL